MTALDKATLETFLPHVGTSFVARLDDETTETFTLETAEFLGRGQDERGRPFSLIFRAEASEPLSQRIYPLDHASLGTLELFLVPLQPDDKGPKYEAVFN